jgi:hypothetical protein
VVGAVRYLILAAGLGLAAWLGVVAGNMGYLIAAAAALFLGNVAIVVQAVRRPGRSTGK